MALLRRLLMKASMSSATKAMSSHHLLGPSGFAKARSSCSSKKEEHIFIVENRPYIPTLLFDANDYEASVIHVAKVILSHHSAAGKIDTSTILSSKTTDKVTVISGGLTSSRPRSSLLSLTLDYPVDTRQASLDLLLVDQIE